MTTTTQPAASTALPSTSLNTNAIFARNEADTTASTVLAGSATILASPPDGTTYGTDADGRYKTYGTGTQSWGSASYGPEYTIMHVIKRVSSASAQIFSVFDPNPPRVYWLQIEPNGTVTGFLFKETDSYVGTFVSTATVSTTTPSTIIYRVKSDGAGGYTARITIDGTSTSETSYGGTAESGSGFELCGRAGVSGFVSKLYYSQVWSRALSDAEVTSLSNGWAIFDEPIADTTITCSLGTATASGFAASILSATIISCSLGTADASGYQATITGSSSITTSVFKNNTGTVLASTTIPKVAAIKLSDLTLAASWTNQTTNGSGVITVGSSELVAATDYLLVTSNADGTAVGVNKYTSS